MIHQSSSRTMKLFPLLLGIILIKFHSAEKVQINETQTEVQNQNPKAKTNENNLNSIYLRRLWRNVNESQEPCDDFYQFACGNWKQHYNEGKEYLDMAGFLEFQYNSDLLKLFESVRNESKVTQKLWDYYESCQRLETHFLNPYLHLLEQHLQIQWPVFRENFTEPWANASVFNWLQVLAKMDRYDFNGILMLSIPNTELSNETHSFFHLQGHEYKWAFDALGLESVFEGFGCDKEYGEKFARQIMELEVKLLNLSLSNEELNMNFTEASEDDSSSPYSIAFLTLNDLEEYIPLLQWRSYFQLVRNQSSPQHQFLIHLNGVNLEYFQALSEILRDTSNETLAYYLMFKFMYKLMPDLKVSNGSHLYCLQHLRSFMSLGMDFVYEQYYFAQLRQETEKVLQAIFSRLKENLKALLLDNRIELNANELAYVVKKLEALYLTVGNIPANLSASYVEKFYSEMPVSATDFIANHLNALKLYKAKILERMSLNADNKSQSFFPYHPTLAGVSTPSKVYGNKILVPYGYLKLPLFHQNLHPFFQYSSLGFILAHEIIHDFDVRFIDMDADEQLNTFTGAKILDHFKDFTQCLNQTPNQIFSENMADIVGIRLVYETFFNSSQNESDLDLDLDLWHFKTRITREQLFFVNSVQFLCSNLGEINKMDEATLNLEHDMHDKRALINWPQYEGLAKAFNCPTTSPMNPKKKCRLW